MADSVPDDHNSHGATSLDPNGAGANTNYFENMGSMDSLATAAHAQAAQQQASYSPHQATAQQAAVTVAAHGMVDPLFYLNDPSQQQQQTQQQYYSQQGYVQGPGGGYPQGPTAEQWQQALSLGGDVNVEFQQLFNHMQQYNHPQQLMLQRGQRVNAGTLEQQQQQQQQQQPGNMGQPTDMVQRVHAQSQAIQAQKNHVQQQQQQQQAQAQQQGNLGQVPDMAQHAQWQALQVQEQAQQQEQQRQLQAQQLRAAQQQQVQDQLLQQQLQQQHQPRPIVTALPRAIVPGHGASADSSNLSSPSSNIGITSPMDLDSAPASAKPSSTPTVRTVPDRTLIKGRADFRPKTAIPQDLTAEEYARQCVQAAIASRLPPYALHPNEYALLKDHINHLQVTTYIHIRNGILRLWQRNPLVSVTREEAAGCAKDYRFFDVSEVAYEVLVRGGYINFGCVEVPSTIPANLGNAKRRRTIVVIGAGMSGLGCARQLEGLFTQFGDRLPAGEGMPKVIVLEARGRLGGRIYSHPLRSQAGANLPEGKRATADLGAQVITGFDNGNPLGVLIRGQLALHYHSLKDNSSLYDSDGTPAPKDRDMLVERLYNDILDRVSIFKQRAPQPRTVEGDRELIDTGKDPAGEGGDMISKVEGTTAGNLHPPTPAPSGQDDTFSASVDKLTGKPSTATGSSARIPGAEQVRKLGWALKPGTTGQETITLEPHGSDSRHPTLGKTMDSALRQYRDIIDIAPRDLRLINWHYANLEYANAANVDLLSLGHWDQDDGNDFSGAHAMLLGGYTQLPRGLWLSPRKLDLRTRHVVKKISYNSSKGVEGSSRIQCENGETLDADKVVITVPLGVLKAETVTFEPPLPDWKSGAIERLGYGLLNKVILVYDVPFWDVENDMVGLLRDPLGDPTIQESYESNRGRFYMFWNCTKASGKPTLVALMAGDAATQTELESDDTLINEAMTALSKMYSDKSVPLPTETIVTRWQKDPYSRGSYSFVGSEATADDYDIMAKPVGNSLYFAGEASCRAYPATVHGAYISGLQAASEIAESILGPIQVPSPLIPPKPKFRGSYSSLSGSKRKAEDSVIEKARELKSARLEVYEEQLKQALVKVLGERPTKPGRSGANPFLLYQKDHWFICKAKCDEARRKATNNPEAKATRNEVRAALGQMWRDAPEDEKRPYLNETENNKRSNAASVTEFKRKLAEWDKAAVKFRKEWKEANPSVPSEDEVLLARQAELEIAEIKRSRKLNGFIDSDDEGY